MRYTGGLSISTDAQLVVAACTSNNTLWRTKMVVALGLDGNVAFEVWIQLGRELDPGQTITAVVAGNDMWLSHGAYLAYLTRDASVNKIENVLTTNTYLIRDIQILNNTLYLGYGNGINVVGKVSSLPKVLSGYTISPLISNATIPIETFFFAYDKDNFYFSFDTGILGIAKATYIGFGTFRTYRYIHPQPCIGIYALDRQGVRYVYFTSDFSLHRVTDTGTSFTNYTKLATVGTILYDVVGLPPGTKNCSNNVKNYDETDVDCGGSCSTRCTNGKNCYRDSDCVINSCINRHCTLPSCVDGAKDQDETDVDCGGTICSARCVIGQLCKVHDDCISAHCLESMCAIPTCIDGVKDQGEGDIDCGGPCSTKCDPGMTCRFDGDCVTNTCTNGTCAPPSCFDGVQNRDETDIDCGGSICGSNCTIGEMCLSHDDCLDLYCGFATCLAPPCSDGEKNQGESDVDCGGPCSNKCDPGMTCRIDSDCVTNTCTNGTCAAPTCFDGVKNQDETDIDCGGSVCLDCATCTCNPQ